MARVLRLMPEFILMKGGLFDEHWIWAWIGLPQSKKLPLISTCTTTSSSYISLQPAQGSASCAQSLATENYRFGVYKCAECELLIFFHGNNPVHLKAREYCQDTSSCKKLRISIGWQMLTESLTMSGGWWVLWIVSKWQLLLCTMHTGFTIFFSESH